MAKFLLLYIGGTSPQTEAEQAQVMQDWTDWFTKLGEAVVDGGEPFTPVSKSLTSSGAVSDGPIGAMATGYSVVTADALDAAVSIAKGCPHLKSGGQITVYETFPVM